MKERFCPQLKQSHRSFPLSLLKFLLNTKLLIIDYQLHVQPSASVLFILHWQKQVLLVAETITMGPCLYFEPSYQSTSKINCSRAQQLRAYHRKPKAELCLLLVAPCFLQLHKRDQALPKATSSLVHHNYKWALTEEAEEGELISKILEEEDKQLGKGQKTANSSKRGREYRGTALKFIKQKWKAPAICKGVIFPT